jgi:hypothetical protein
VSYGKPGKRKKRKVRVLKEFRLDEISIVDKPAQEGARIVLMKRDGGVEKGDIWPDGGMRSPRLTTSVDGHSHLLDASSEAGVTTWSKTEGEEYGHDHPFIRKPDGSIEIGESDGHGHAVIPLEAMKRDVSSEERERLAEAGNALPDGSFPVANVQDLKNAIQAFGRAKDKEAAASHIKRRAKELGQEELLPEEGMLAKSETTGGSGGGQPTERSMTKSETAATPDVVAKQLEAAQAELKIAKAYGALSDAEKKYCGALPEAERDEFIQKDAGARAALVQKSLEADAVVYTSETGETFRKSDDPRLVRLAKQADESARLAKAEREALQNERLAKRAEAELSACPGETPVKVALLKAVDGISDASLRASASAILKAGNDALSKGFDTFGTSGSAGDGGKADAEQKLEALAKRYAADNKCSLVEARDRVLDTDEGAALVLEMRS